MGLNTRIKTEQFFARDGEEYMVNITHDALAIKSVLL